MAVNYAKGVRRFLLERFANVRLVLFERRVFPGVLEEVMLLLAEGTGPTDHFEVQHVRNLAELNANGQPPAAWAPVDREGKWLPALISPDAAARYAEITGGDDFSTLLDWGGTSLGRVTGNNRYFTLTAAEAQEHGLTVRDLLRISPPGSRHLRGMTFTEEAWHEMMAQGTCVPLLSGPELSLFISCSKTVHHAR